MAKFEKASTANLARDSQDRLCYLAASEFHLQYCMKKWPSVTFHKTGMWAEPS